MTSRNSDDTHSGPAPIRTDEGTQAKTRAPENSRQPDPREKNVLSSLRRGWIADYETAPQGKRRPLQPQGSGIGKTLQIIRSELALFSESAMGLVRAILSSMARGASGALKKNTTGAALAGLFAIVIAIGGLVYLVLVDHIFRQGQPTTASTVDAPAATPAPPVSSPPAADTPASGVAQSTNQPSGFPFQATPQAGDSAPSPVGTFGLPGNFADSNGTSSMDGASSGNDRSGAAALADSTAASRMARKQGAPSQPAAAGSSNPAYAAAPPSSGSAASSPRNAFQGAQAAVARPAATDWKTLVTLESAQVMAASGAGHGDVEGTAFAAIAHGGRAVFEVQHLRTSGGASCPARIVVTATSLALIPDASCEAGAVTIPLAAVTSVETAQVTPQAAGAEVLNIEFNDRGKNGKGRLSLAGSPAHAAGARGAQPLSHLRNVIVGVAPSSVGGAAKGTAAR